MTPNNRLKQSRLTLLVACSIFLAPLLQPPGALALSPADKAKAQKYAALAINDGKKSQTQDQAVRDIDAAIALDGTNSTYWAIKSNLLSIIGEDAEALKAIDGALKLNPHSGDYWSLKAEMLMSLKRRPEAKEAVATALKNKPTKSEVLRISNTYTGLQMPMEAKNLLDGLIKASPEDEVLRTRRAVCASTLRDWDLVIEDTSVGQRHGTHNFSQMKNLELRANAYMQKKQYDKAVADYKTVLHMVPDDRIGHQGLLDTYRLMGDKNGAKKEETYLKGLDQDYRPI